MSTSSIKSRIRRFHAVVVQSTSKKCTKTDVMHVQSSCLQTNRFLTLSLWSLLQQLLESVIKQQAKVLHFIDLVTNNKSAHLRAQNVVIRILTPRLPDKVRFVVPGFFRSVITHDSSLLRNFSTALRDHKKRKQKYEWSDTLISTFPLLTFASLP